MAKLDPYKFEFNKTDLPILSQLDEKKIPIRLGLIRSNEFPLVISLWYYTDNEKIYCATKKDALIVKYITHNSRCSFELAADNPPYRGIRGYGICHINPDSGKQILEKLMNKYLSEKQTKLKQYLTAHNDREVALEIIPYSVSSYDYTRRMSAD
ncbi:MAG: hypothetical protein EB149_05135 [Thaumarchaeota archaeon]|nr:hypothetical protein [Nitrososphaerota archaeon]